METVVLASLDLVAHIDLAGGILAHKHHGEAGLVTLLGQAGGALGGFGTDLFGKGVAVDQLGGHGILRERLGSRGRRRARGGGVADKAGL
ncbi:hypothetical protein D3C86_1789630 [compost metagenome]